VSASPVEKKPLVVEVVPAEKGPPLVAEAVA
jgi:hypothetical protein